MNNDLISREALKEDFKSRLADCNEWIEKAKDKETKIRASAVKAFIAEVIMTIDNAPPVPQVTVFTETADEKAVADLKAELQNVIEARPQGEWCYGEDECGQDGWFCSKCGFFVPWYYQYYEKDINFIRDYKACPHCLAEMVTYTGKDRDTKGGTE